MSGIFSKLKEKKGEWDKKGEEGKVDQIQKQMDSAFEDFKKHLGKQLGKLGLSLAHASLSGANATARVAGCGLSGSTMSKAIQQRWLKLARASAGIALNNNYRVDFVLGTADCGGRTRSPKSGGRCNSLDIESKAQFGVMAEFLQL